MDEDFVLSRNDRMEYMMALEIEAERRRLSENASTSKSEYRTSIEQW